MKLREYSVLFWAFFLGILTSSAGTGQRNATNATAGWRASDEEKAWCPSVQELHLCTCSGPASFPLVVCDRVVDPFTIREASKLFDNMRNIGKFSLINSRISVLRHNDLGLIQCEYFYARKNTVTTVESGFFNCSRNTLKRIDITHNDVENFPFADLAAFPKLEYLNLKYNSLKRIPDYAFGNSVNTKMRKIVLSFNKITHVGSNAFKYLCGLELLDLRFNKLTVINNYAFAALFGNPKLSMDLSSNKIMFISEGAFENQIFQCLNLTENNMSRFPDKIFLDMIKEMARTRHGVILVKNNRFRCTCENLGWLVRLPDDYRRRVVDLECADKNNKNVKDLSIYDIGCQG